GAAGMHDVNRLDIVETIREGVLVVEPDLTIRFANRSAFAWCEPSRTLHFPSLFSVGLGPRSISAVAGAAYQSDPHVSIHRRNHAMLSRFTGNGVLPSRVKDYASRPASAALASHSDNAALSSCAARDGAIGRHLWKY